jgi:hypothetical protein
LIINALSHLQQLVPGFSRKYIFMVSYESMNQQPFWRKYLLLFLRYQVLVLSLGLFFQTN